MLSPAVSGAWRLQRVSQYDGGRAEAKFGAIRSQQWTGGGF
jgi:hypothetical protein